MLLIQKSILSNPDCYDNICLRLNPPKNIEKINERIKFWFLTNKEETFKINLYQLSRITYDFNKKEIIYLKNPCYKTISFIPWYDNSGLTISYEAKNIKALYYLNKKYKFNELILCESKEKSWSNIKSLKGKEFIESKIIKAKQLERPQGNDYNQMEIKSC